MSIFGYKLSIQEMWVNGLKIGTSGQMAGVNKLWSAYNQKRKYQLLSLIPVFVFDTNAVSWLSYIHTI